MKIVRFSTNGKTKYGILNGNSIQAISGTPFRNIKTIDEYYDLSRVKLLAPVMPSKIVALGLNYKSHAKEFNTNTPDVPLLFIKPSTSVIGPGENIIYPESSKQVDYEAELGIVIKKRAVKVCREAALAYVLGYTCLNDVTARDQQSADKQWTRAKSYDTFAPIGPHIETDLDPDNVQVESYLNGKVKQSASTRDLVFSVPVLIEFISHIMTLLPGDIIATGTPGGIGPMLPGDTIEIKVSGIGTLLNTVVRQI